jgi:hypothetical protein
MQASDIARRRLRSHHIEPARFTRAAEVARHMLALQAQDHHGGLWSIALRTPQLTKQDVEQAIADRELIRTWPMRGTLHLLAAEDVRWMVALLAPRATAAAATRRKELGIDEDVVARARDLFGSALAGGGCLPRNEMFDVLDRGGVDPSGQRGSHLLRNLAEQGMLCFGPRDGAQPTFVLLDEWVPAAPAKDRDEALAELARRYMTSHGPASLKDLAGWGRMTITDARRGLSEAEQYLESAEIDGVRHWFAPDPAAGPGTGESVRLLPGFDEFILGYKERSAVLAPEYSERIVPGGNGMFRATILINGQVAGTWSLTRRAKEQRIALEPFKPVDQRYHELIDAEVTRYARYSGSPATWDIAPR